MAIPAIKGVIIVSGIAVAVGVALSEHEPFREWADQTWKKTNKAFDDFIDDIIPEARQRRMNNPWGTGAEHIPFGRSGGQRGWPFQKRRRSPSPSRREEKHDQQGESSARDEDRQGLLRRRRGSGGGQDTELDVMSARVLSDEAILEQAAQESLDTMPDDERKFVEDLVRARQASLEEHERTTAAEAGHNEHSETVPRLGTDNQSTPETSHAHDEVSPPSTPGVKTPVTPATQPGTPFHTTRSESGFSDDSLDVLSQRQYTPLGSEADMMSDAHSEAGTETMSHVSQDPEMGGDVDEVRSMASSWSQVSDDEFALRDREAR